MATVDNDVSIGKDDLYSGHKVVAMPTSAFGGMSVRDVVSSRNTDDYRRPAREDRRSRSAGRKQISRSRDIVQEVYDRMGVNYTRGHSSLEINLDDTVSTQAGKNDTTRTVSRGRSITRRGETPEKSKLGTPRSRKATRSLSKGRVANIWPPLQTSTNGTLHSNDHDVALEPRIALAPQKERIQNQRHSMPQPNKMCSRDIDARQSYPESRDEERHDQSTAQDDDRDAQSTVSVKDRVSAYGGVKQSSGSSRNVRRSYNNQFTKRDHPPKVDIYDIRSEDQDVRAESGNVGATETVTQNSYVGSGKKRFSSALSVSHMSVKSGVADAFLAAISSKSVASPKKASSKNISIMEIPSDELNAPTDIVSLAASSVSGEDFASLSPKKTMNTRIANFSSVPRLNGQLPSQVLEQMVDERVQAQLASHLITFQREITQSEKRMEEACRARIEELEQKTENALSMMMGTMPKKSSSNC